MTKFICISGKAQAGKDTSAKYFKQQLESDGYRVLITHYADLLKYMCKTYFGWNGEKDEQGRTLLQRVGTDCVRAQNPNYWVDFVISVVAMFPDDWDYVIIPDLRFPNELQRIRDAGYETWHIGVERPDHNSGLTTSQLCHSSETALDGIVPTFTINNSYSLSTLMEQIRIVCEQLNINTLKGGANEDN